jgi:hypothetical protein
MYRHCDNFTEQMIEYANAQNDALSKLMKKVHPVGEVRLRDVIEVVTFEGALQLGVIANAGGHWYEQDARELIEDVIEKEGGWGMAAYHLKSHIVAIRVICEGYEPSMSDDEFIQLLEKNNVGRWVLLRKEVAL